MFTLNVLLKNLGVREIEAVVRFIEDVFKIPFWFVKVADTR